MRAESFHADGRTDMTKLVVAFRNFATPPEKWQRFYMQIYKEFWVYVRDWLNTDLSSTLSNEIGKRELNMAAMLSVFSFKFYKSQNGDWQVNGSCRKPKVNLH